MCSIDSNLWCWDATTQAASDDTLSQRLGWRRVLSFSFEVGACQGRVTLPCESLQGVRAPNTLSPRPSLPVINPCGFLCTMGYRPPLNWIRLCPYYDQDGTPDHCPTAASLQLGQDRLA